MKEKRKKYWKKSCKRRCTCESEVTQSCLTLCNPADYSLPGFSIHGILQARILGWVTISFSRGIFQTQGLNPSLLYLLHWQRDSLPLCHLGSLPCAVLATISMSWNTGSGPPMRLLLLLSHFSRVQLCATPSTTAHQAPVPGILQARTLEWVAISFSSA